MILQKIKENQVLKANQRKPTEFEALKFKIQNQFLKNQKKKKKIN